MKELEADYFAFEPANAVKELAGSKAIFFSELYSTQFEDDSPVVYLPPLLSGSDYSVGGIVNKANQKAFMRDFEELEGVAWWRVLGGYNSYAIAILNDCENEEIEEWLGALERDPVADEQLLSDMETEEEAAAWKEYYRREFVRAMEERFSVDLSDADDVTIDGLAIRGQELANVYWEHEAQGPWLDIIAMADALPANTFAD